jgi:hypothetical protein
MMKLNGFKRKRIDTFTVMEQFIKDRWWIDNDKNGGYLFGQTEQDMKESGRIISKMDRASFIT